MVRAWLLAVVVGCGGGGLGDGECRDARDCEEGQSCSTPGRTSNLCGIGPQDLCRDGCGADQYCRYFEEGCGEYSCVDRCDDDGACGADEACDPATRECVPRACDDGYTCPEGTRCAGSGDAHGCVRATCDGDRDCDDGLYCVVGACFPEPGSCGSDEPVP